MSSEQRLSPSGRYLLLETRGAPESLVPLEDLPNNGRQYEREFTPASERDLTPRPIIDWNIFGD
jgi:hypothetical protein